MERALVREITFLPNGVEGLLVRSGGRNLLLRLVMGRRISFKMEGEPPSGQIRDPCVMCDGSSCLKGKPDCLVPHVVYLVLFGRLAKVGVTRAARFERRMREQGARFAARISEQPDGLRARRVEKEMAAKEGLRGGIRFEEKVGSLWDLRDIKEAGKIAGSLSLPGKPELEDLDYLYQNPALSDMPRPLVMSGESVKGRIVDTRGEALYVKHRDNLYAFDLRRTVGRSILLGGTRIDAQLTIENF